MLLALHRGPVVAFTTGPAILGGGGTSSHDDIYGPPDSSHGNDDGQLMSQIYTTYPQVYKAAANETELATWSAVRDPYTTYPWGIGVFDVDPGRFPDDQTSISMTYYHTPRPRPRTSTRHRWCMTRSPRSSGAGTACSGVAPTGRPRDHRSLSGFLSPESAGMPVPCGSCASPLAR